VMDLSEVTDFLAVPGKGIKGSINARAAVIGNREFVLAETGGSGGDESAEFLARSLETAGATVVYFSYDRRLAGFFAVSDTVRPEAQETIRLLGQSNRESVMITGDAPATAESVARTLGVRTVKARRTPEEKAGDVRIFRESGKSCAMVGDGINDAPALVEAEVGIAMGRATDIALESADMVLMRNDLRLVPLALRLAKRTFSVIKQNLFWAFFYNVVTIPLAVMGVLHPIVAAGAMALSSLSVVGNSLRARVRQ